MTVINAPGKAYLPLKSARFDDKAPASQFACQDTTPKNGGNIRVALACMVMAVPAGIVFGFLGFAIWQPLGYLLYIVPPFMALRGLWAVFFGVPDFYREAPCVHCGTTITVRNEENKPGKCETCGERVVLRKGQLHYPHRAA